MHRFGVRRVLTAALTILALATGSSYFMTSPWQFVLTWGVAGGLAAGCMSVVLGSIIVNRWFTTNRGLMMGILTASAASGLLVFLPAMAAIATNVGWQGVVLVVAAASAALIPLVLWLVPEYPADIGLAPFGAEEIVAPPATGSGGNPFAAAINGLVRCSRHGDFWLLAGGFFICGFTTNGLVGTHLISFCADHGIAEVTAAGLVAVMGLFDLVGTTASGWLTDRFDPRKLLFMYYGLRGLVAHLPAVHRLLAVQSVVLRRLLRPRLDRDRAADGAARGGIVRRERRFGGVRLDPRLAHGGRGVRGVPGGVPPHGAGQLRRCVPDRRDDRAGGGAVVAAGARQPRTAGGDRARMNDRH